MFTRQLGIALLAVLLSALPARGGEKPDKWVEVRSPHFVVLSNANEKAARRAAGQFERFRDVIRTVLPRLQVESRTPLLIIAVKDENSLKALLPEYWEKKGGTRFAGYFQRGMGKDYVVLRLDAPGENPYQVIYHEYVHRLMSVNLGMLPVWLNEGFAEFFGHASIGDKEAGTGRPSAYQLELLQNSRLLPLDVLFAVDQKSPEYNEKNKSSIFYAQSWALTHYFMISERGARHPILMEFLKLLGQGVPESEAATKAFGDLKKLEKELAAYVRQGNYFYYPVKLRAGTDEKEYALREVPEAESLAARGDFLVHSNKMDRARPLLEEALKLDPNQALAHESMGFLHFRKNEREEAAKSFAAAVRLDSKNYLAQYYYAMLESQGGDAMAKVEEHLRKAIELNPEFAPAYSMLAIHYAMRDAKLEEALKLATKAAQLEPGVLAHHFNVANVLLRMDRVDDAIRVTQRALNAAKTEEERAMGHAVLQSAQQYHEFLAQRKRYEEENARAKKEWEEAQLQRQKEEQAAEAAAKQQPDEAPGGPKSGPRASATGKIAAVQCSQPVALDLTLESGSGTVKLHAGNYFKIEFYSINWKPPDDFQPCKDLQGLSAKVTYRATPGQAYAGEILRIEVRK